MMTLAQFLEKQPIFSDKDLAVIVTSLSRSVAQVSELVATAAFRGLTGLTGATNIQGEQTEKLDDAANNVFKEALVSLESCALLVSEEEEQVIEAKGKNAGGAFLISYDPLDGSSNLGVNVSVGSIFSIVRRTDTSLDATETEFFSNSRRIEVAGYSVYGPSTLFVLGIAGGVFEFTLHPQDATFYLTDEQMRIPEDAKIYSVNEGNSSKWSGRDKAFIDSLKVSAASDKNLPSSARYIGSLVADFHRNLKKGGIFLYPADTKNKRGKLRLLYECAPMAFVIEQAGGKAVDDSTSILDLVPSSIHERCPLVIGSKNTVSLYEESA